MNLNWMLSVPMLIATATLAAAAERRVLDAAYLDALRHTHADRHPNQHTH